VKQLSLDLGPVAAYGRADFFASEANAAALARIESWPEWRFPVLIVHGSAGAGKTHLAHIWCERAGAALVAGDALGSPQVAAMLSEGGAMAVDGADRAPEAALLHLYNACVEMRGGLLLTSRRSATDWQPALADLASRLRATPAVAIDPPDDALLAAVLAKHFADRQLRVGSEVVGYLLRHMERSLAAVAAIAAALDQAALDRHRAVTTRLAANVLDRLAAQSAADSEAGVT
jgi:chromosomal replication initiation ATPase DnaA